MKRVFFSFHVPRPKAEMIMEGLERKDLSIILYPPQNLHITLKFVGEVSDAQLEDVIAIGNDVAKNFTTRKIDFIPRGFSIEGNRLRFGIKLNDDLINLHGEITERLLEKKIGKVDMRPYSPHVTIGRPDEKFEMQPLNMFELERFLFSLDHFGLYESTPGSQNLGEYTLLHRFELQK